MKRLLSENGFTNRTAFIGIITFLVLLCYEIATKHITNIVTETYNKNFNSVEEYREHDKNFNSVEDYREHNITGNIVKPVENIENNECERNVRLAEYGEMKIVFLNSFPGSGNTWSRHLIEDITGIYSGSVYSERKMIDAGFVGESEEPTSGRTIVVKNHGQSKMEYADGIVLVVRNPYNAIIADYNRQVSHSHTGSVDLTKFSGDKWENFVAQHSKRWWSGLLWYPTYAKRGNIPLQVIFYEDLKEDLLNQMKTILTFFEKFNLTVPDSDLRLDCLQRLDQSGMYRKKKKLEVELFPDSAIEYLDNHISVVKKMFELQNLPPIRDEYYKRPERANTTSEDDVHTFIYETKINMKVNLRLQFRDVYKDSGMTARSFAESGKAAPKRHG